MRITVRVKPGAKKADVENVGPNEFIISVTEQPDKGRATAAVRRALAQALGIPQSRLSLVMGMASRTKVFEVL